MTRRPRLILRAWLSGAAIACAVAAPAQAQARATGVDGLAGVYKQRFPDALMSGEKYVGEDILEVVKLSPTAAYIRVHLDAANGHTCTLWGLADVEADALVYRARRPPFPGAAPCVLKLRTADGKIVFDDAGRACKTANCGERGSFDGQTFPLSARRPIRYMPSILRSSEYRDALAEHAVQPPPS